VNTRTHYDVVIIGAGLSGLAAGIRLAHFGRSVCIFERHAAPGGLNGFYSIGGRKYDVGLHAVTNYSRPGERGTPLGKLLRQLRIDRGQFELCEQRQSRVAFGTGAGAVSLRFTNDFAVLEAEVARLFPSGVDGFRRLAALVRATPFSPDAPPSSAREVVRRHIADRLLEEMILCPLLFYGSARERDMDFGQFCLLFQAIFLEGMARPFGGIREILRVLLDKYREAGGEKRMRCGVARIETGGGRVAALVLATGERITAGEVLSSIGAPETAALVAAGTGGGTGGRAAPESGRVTFVETMTVFDRQPAEMGWGDDTIVFFNDSDRFEYASPREAVDTRSGVVCIPNNFDFGPGRVLPDGMLRVTCLASPDRWASLAGEAYRQEKRRWFFAVQESGRRFLPPLPPGKLEEATVASDMFTPSTITRFTGRLNGAIYGSPSKSLNGETGLANLHLCGTDQGLLGIVGAMLSGITMANRHVLLKAGS
jgi:phytoene dehydrogenase-like protein